MPNANVKPCAEACGFELLHQQDVREIEGWAYVFAHTKSGARLLYLANDDNNKGFSITFKTPAANDTGVFHILEHSVLCGSERFPVKEPFVNLLKSSMQTFLNAMTFPDKTMYPVASTNERDLLNLMDVYLDAVFHPNIYRNPRIFEQEGWHFELDGENGDLIYNGVVYNEMKGALSDPESVLYDALSAALFPDTTYRFESGGTPEAIPTLTYEEFLEAHTKHYHPSNSYVILYGNMDPEPFLKQVDEYLTGALGGTPAPNAIGRQSPVVAEGIKKSMVTAPENSCAALGFVAGEANQRERMLALSILVDAIMGSNEAPLKRALLDADIADDCDGFLSDSLMQPFVAITARGLHDDDAANKLRDTVAQAAADLAHGGLDMQLVEAALSHAEFVLREGNFGYADGVMLSMMAMNGWLYDDAPEASLEYIRYEDVLASLREKLAGEYFSQLLADVFVDSDHRAQVQVVPVAGDEEAEELAKLKKLERSMTSEELESIAAEAKALQDAQAAPDAPEDLAKLPKLSRADVGAPPEEPACTASKLGDIAVLRHEVETHGIVYATRFFDMGNVAFDELPYAGILAIVLGKLDTAAHTAAEIDTIVQGKLGSLDFSCDVYDMFDDDERTWAAKFAVGASALEGNADVAAILANEILTSTDFGDTGKILDILVQRKVAMEQRFAMAGNSVAAARAASYIFPAAVLRQSMGGVDFYGFIKQLIEDFDARAKDLTSKLQELCKRLFNDSSSLLSFAGSEDAYQRYVELAPLGNSNVADDRSLSAPMPTNKREALVVPTDVTYSALVSDRFSLDQQARLSGSWMVASKVLSYDYLWNEVRVMGGAYGVSFSSARAGASSFSSYRDPHVSETLERFRCSSQWLSVFNPLPDEFEGYVVSTAASFDKPLKPRDLIRRQCSMYLTNNTRDEFLRIRQEVLDASIDDVKALAPALKELCESGCVCVVGNKDIIEQANSGLSVIDLLAI